MDNEKDQIIINVSDVVNVSQLHSLLMKQLEFPDFYGMNWDAFWDAITGLVEMPKKLIFIGWNNVIEHIPDDAKIMENLLFKLNEKYPSWGCEVEFK